MINYFFTSHFMIHGKAGYFLKSSPEQCIKYAIYEIKIKKLYTALDFLYIKMYYYISNILIDGSMGGG